jgi:hypothetical protein
VRSSHTASVRDLVVANRPNRIGRDGNHGKCFTGQRRELHLESGVCSVHEHDRAHVALLETLLGDVSGQHHQVVFADCYFCTPRNGYLDPKVVC